MRFLQRIGASVLTFAAILAAILLLWRASSSRRKAERWRQTAEEAAAGQRDGQLRDADYARKKADAYDQAAKAIATEAEARLDALAERSEAVSDILDRWRAERVRRDV